MFLADLNWFAIVAATLAAFVAGAIWFGPKTFYPVWWKLMGKEPTENPGSATSMVIVFASTAIAAFVEAIAVAAVIFFVAADQPDFGTLQGGLTGLLLGIGLAAASSLSHRLFAGHGFRVWIIEVGSDIVNLTIMGLIIGSWR